jgi:Zn-dependent peptidase ImmA (M78 family)
MEQQANHFAACLLMPAPVIRLLFAIYVQRHLGSFYYPISADGCCAKQDIIMPIAKAMNVSVAAVTFRLTKLGLIYSKPPVHHFLPAS